MILSSLCLGSFRKRRHHRCPLAILHDQSSSRPRDYLLAHTSKGAILSTDNLHLCVRRVCILQQYGCQPHGTIPSTIPSHGQYNDISQPVSWLSLEVWYCTTRLSRPSFDDARQPQSQAAPGVTWVSDSPTRVNARLTMLYKRSATLSIVTTS